MGISLVLCSQNLSGFDVRPNLGNFLNRLVLRMDQRDSVGFLSDDNPAAAALPGRGAAIMNTGSGLRKHNREFQVSWISDDEIPGIIATLNKEVEIRKLSLPVPVVRDRKRVADPLKDIETFALLSGQVLTPLEEPLAIRIGEADRIGAPAANFFLRRRSGGNVLLVGGKDSTVADILLQSLKQLAAQTEGRASIAIVDFMKLELPQVCREAGACHRTLEGMEKLTEELTLELARRRATKEPAEPMIIFLLDPYEELGLRKVGFTPSGPIKAFQKILEDGPKHGLHCFVFSSLYQNIAEVLEFPRQKMMFETRMALFGVDSLKVLEECGTVAAPESPSSAVLQYLAVGARPVSCVLYASGEM